MGFFKHRPPNLDHPRVSCVISDHTGADRDTQADVRNMPARSYLHLRSRAPKPHSEPVSRSLIHCLYSATLNQIVISMITNVGARHLEQCYQNGTPINRGEAAHLDADLMTRQAGRNLYMSIQGGRRRDKALAEARIKSRSG
jgi:hypothetical protein